MDGRASGPGQAVHHTLSSYFDALHDAFARAARCLPQRDFERNLAGHRFRIACAGDTLASAVTGAFDHLPQVDGREQTSLEILAWDEAATGVARPDPPWSWPQSPQLLQYALPAGGEAFRIHYSEQEAIFSIYSVEAARAFVVCGDAARLPTYFYASPCAPVIHWWRRGAGLHTLHAGCVGERGMGVLLVGPSGSGKSTTSLLCALDGMNYVSDDVCLLRPGADAEAFCLYNSGKLHSGHLQNFAAYAAVAIDPGPTRDDKPVVLLHRHFAGRVVPRLAVKAVIAPRVTGRPRTVVTPMTAADAMKVLAPSTMFMSPPFEANALRVLADLVRSRPCFRLDLGTAVDQIPDAVRSVLVRAG